MAGSIRSLTGDVWVYDFESEQFTPLVDEASPRLKAAG